LVDVMSDEIAVHDVVASLDQPVGIATRATTDVGHDRGRVGQRARDDLDGAEVLDSPGAGRESVSFFVARVVRLHRSLIGHALIWHVAS